MEITPFEWALIWNMIIALSIIIIVFISSIIKQKLIAYLEYITATTVWLLMWIIFLWFIPKLTTQWQLVWEKLGIFILLWLLLFYIFELFLHWHHCKDLGHDHGCKSWHSHDHKNWILMFWGTVLHNWFHGIVLFSAFSVDLHFWIATTVAVLLHSVPQNIVNYIMNHNKILYSFIAAFWGLVWTLLTYPFSNFLIKNKWISILKYF